ncbi:hypothetical protein C9374_008457 [Naegleria lovaniensis]|uniref:Uncharacterized protein n=1 Tax=Naegleria lovaniensis TaxID=51637 RepID=A0AA88KKZ2_NAELO|nr:uncharacterized protein C9374_008457 [Naegleria lovaniensis]KAG2378314.1 hypothetical protein C9374_008457 [Naegleria lovaniensis]
MSQHERETLVTTQLLSESSSSAIPMCPHHHNNEIIPSVIQSIEPTTFEIKNSHIQTLCNDVVKHILSYVKYDLKTILAFERTCRHVKSCFAHYWKMKFPKKIPVTWEYSRHKKLELDFYTCCYHGVLFMVSVKEYMERLRQYSDLDQNAIEKLGFCYSRFLLRIYPIFQSYQEEAVKYCIKIVLNVDEKQLPSKIVNPKNPKHKHFPSSHEDAYARRMLKRSFELREIENAPSSASPLAPSRNCKQMLYLVNSIGNLHIYRELLYTHMISSYQKPLFKKSMQKKLAIMGSLFFILMVMLILGVVIALFLFLVFREKEVIKDWSIGIGSTLLIVPVIAMCAFLVVFVVVITHAIVKYQHIKKRELKRFMLNEEDVLRMSI